jgi:hypothetical protein
VAQGTYGGGINAAGIVAGQSTDAGRENHGFVRAANGTITIFEAPGASMEPRKGTTPVAINAAGTVTGCFRDDSNVYHGFLRTP